MYSSDFRAAEIRARQDSFHQQARNDARAKVVRAAGREHKGRGRQVRHPGPASVVQAVTAALTRWPGRSRPAQCDPLR